MTARRPPRKDGSEHGPGVLRRVAGSAVRSVRGCARPLGRMYDSDDPLDSYALVHLTSAGGDALVAVALADSVFFSLPLDEAKIRVALYLALTMAPLAVAAPLLVPLLDRGGFRRAISFAAAAGRSGAALYAAPRFDSDLLFPVAFALLVLSKVHVITKNGLTMAYAPSHQGLVRANARLGRLAVVGFLLAAGPGLLLVQVGGSPAVLYAAVAVYGLSALMNLRLPQPEVEPEGVEVAGRGRVPALATAAAGAAGLRAASGFLLFLLAFALRGGDQPAYWFAVLGGSAVAGGAMGDVLAPRLPASAREETVVLGSLVAAGAGALLAVMMFNLWVLALFAALAGMATEFGRLAFQSLMQRLAPGWAHGRVFVRYEVAFQLAWVAGAFVPAVAPVSFKAGVALMAAFYLLLGGFYLLRPMVRVRTVEPEPGPAS